MDPIEEYLEYIRTVRRYSDRTVDIYQGVLVEFSSFVEGNVTESLTPQMVRSYEVHLLEDKEQSPKTVNQHLSVLSSFSRFLVKRDRIPSNPVSTVTRPKVPKRLPEYFRRESLDSYLSATDYLVSEYEAFSAPKYYEPRLQRLIINILYCTGIRRAELISLNISSFDSSRRIMSVLGKGNKMREIPLLPSLCHEICIYLQSVESTVIEVRSASDPLLVTKNGKRLYPVYIDRVVKSTLGDSGVTSRKSPHVLRHTLATELLDEGADINSIKEMLGHSSLAATQVYTHTSVDRLKKVYFNAHPRAKNGGNNGD